MFHFHRALFGYHYKLERNSIALVVGVVVAASIGGLVEIAPLFTIHGTVEDAPGMRVYTPLETAGRNIYIREGCYLIRDAQRVIEAIESLVRIHNAQEEDIYEHAAEGR